MGIFNSKFGKSTKINHDFFGSMLFMENKKNPNQSYFECRRHFKPSNQLIEIGLTAELIGPTQNQIDFFKIIEDKYLEITQSVSPIIEAEFQNWKSNFKIENFQSEFRPVYLQIPKSQTTPIIWEIAFETDHDLDHTFTLTMHDFVANEILVDG
jgi:hypothetical protein